MLMGSAVECIKKWTLEGRVAIVTGGTKGIGKLTAFELLRRNCRVMVCSRKEESVAEAVGEFKKTYGPKVSGAVCHVGKAEDRESLVQRTVREFGGIDVLVSFAGVNPAFGPMMECTESQMAKLFEVNVTGSFAMAQLVVPEMLKREQQSNILFMSAYSSLFPIDVSNKQTSKHFNALTNMYRTWVPIRFRKPPCWP